MLINGSIQKEGITIVNICTSNIRAPQYIRKILKALKGGNSNTIRAGILTPYFHQWINHPDRISIRTHRP